MFRFSAANHHSAIGFPRIRGDVPPCSYRNHHPAQFSPHTRGCSPVPSWWYGTKTVFPAYAGMFRNGIDRENHAHCFPRIRGDVPFYQPMQSPMPLFSPHTRGCSCKSRPMCSVSHVFPAYAGMFRTWYSSSRGSQCFPRIRGDVPGTGESAGLGLLFSPHTRGCSFTFNCVAELLIVFPAYAGMFLIRVITGNINNRFPRIRGDVPVSAQITILRRGFSPHTRGCS